MGLFAAVHQPRCGQSAAPGREDREGVRPAVAQRLREGRQGDEGGRGRQADLRGSGGGQVGGNCL